MKPGLDLTKGCQMLFDQHRSKIKTAEEVRLLLKQRTKTKTVMCHGVFDILHPGHLQHLSYAKSQAEVLIVSVTADQWVTKGIHRPHVPQDLRALSVAMLGIVDFVIVHDDKTPVDLIRLLRPDYYAKGFEYSETARPGRTIVESAVVAEYGGEMLFTPGDVVYSSTALLDASAPDLRYEKLRAVMERGGVSFDLLRKTVAAIDEKLAVHVVGDVIVDSYTRCAALGSQPKTPTLSVLKESREDFVGGAGIVAKHIAAAGASATLSTVLGNDALRTFVRGDLYDAGVRLNALIDETRPTTNKNAFVVDNYRLLKVDNLDNRSISDDLLEALRQYIVMSNANATIFSDFRHGIFNSRTIPVLTAAIPSSSWSAADSQVASRWGNITDFKKFNMITPNEREARFCLGDQDSGIRPLASKLHDAAECAFLILTLGERGVFVSMNKRHEAPDSFFALDSFADKVIDPVGAGDALLAYATLGDVISGSAVVAAILGVFAASAECEFDGNVPIRAEYVLSKIDAAEKA